MIYKKRLSWRFFNDLFHKLALFYRVYYDRLYFVNIHKQVGVLMREKILKLLMHQYPDYISGELLSEMLGISRAAIWKHIKTLRAEGYEIHSVTNKGYALVTDSMSLNQPVLEELLEPFDQLDFTYHYDTIDSTNMEAKRMAMVNQNAQGLVVAAEQTAGKGRMGRVWESKKTEGLWMSLLLRPNVNIEAAPLITLVAATAMCETLRNLTKLDVQIKWPNDLVIHQKKVCGILTEMSSELDQLHYVVLGLGLNVSQTAFDEALKQKATSLYHEGVEVGDKQILRQFLEVFFEYYKAYLKGNVEKVMAFHRLHSATLGKEVRLIDKLGERIVEAFDVDDSGGLIIKNEKKQLERIISGEVSVRGLNGYI